MSPAPWPQTTSTSWLSAIRWSPKVSTVGYHRLCTMLPVVLVHRLLVGLNL